MTYKKFFGFVVFIFILIVILVFLSKFVLIKDSKIDIDNTEYKQKVDSIKQLDVVINSLEFKLKENETKINNLDDSSTVKLFIELVKGE